MGRPLRYLPHPHTTFEVTTRTIHGRLFLKPSKRLNELLLWVIGRALSYYPSVALHLFVVVSNHMHLILTVPDSKTLSLFMGYINSNIAREAGRLHGWREKFWGRRYRAIPILDEPALVERVRYLLSHGSKEGLVRRPEDWPGVHCIFALRDGIALSGTWIDRTKQYEAKRAGEESKPNQFAIRYKVQLTPLPCWTDLPERERRRRIGEMLLEIESDVCANRKEKAKTEVLGKQKVLIQHPHTQPEQSKKSKAPLCHCSSIEKWMNYRNAYRFFVDVFRMAAKRLRRHRQLVPFPEHSFMPSMGYWATVGAMSG